MNQPADPVLTPACAHLEEYGLYLLEQEGYVLNAKGQLISAATARNSILNIRRPGQNPV